MGRKCQIQKNRKNSHSKLSQTVASKKWRCRNLSETVARTSANNAISYARTHEIQTICRQCTDKMDCLTCSVAHSSFSEAVRHSLHSIVPWKDGIVQNWWNLEKQFSHIFQMPQCWSGRDVTKRERMQNCWKEIVAISSLLEWKRKTQVRVCPVDGVSFQQFLLVKKKGFGNLEARRHGS